MGGLEIDEQLTGVRNSLAARDHHGHVFTRRAGEPVLDCCALTAGFSSSNGASQNCGMKHIALLFSGGSAVGLSATGAWTEPLPVMRVNVSEFGQVPNTIRPAVVDQQWRRGAFPSFRNE
jgi:hypothetical protein